MPGDPVLDLHEQFLQAQLAAKGERGLRRELAELAGHPVFPGRQPPILQDIQLSRMAEAERLLQEAQLGAEAAARAKIHMESSPWLRALSQGAEAVPFIGPFLPDLIAGAQSLLEGEGFGRGYRRSQLERQLIEEYGDRSLIENIARGLGVASEIGLGVGLLSRSGATLSGMAARRLAGPTSIEALGGLSEPLKRALLRQSLQGAIQFGEYGAIQGALGGVLEGTFGKERGFGAAIEQGLTGAGAGAAHGVLGGAFLGALGGLAGRGAGLAVERLSRMEPRPGRLDELLTRGAGRLGPLAERLRKSQLPARVDEALARIGRAGKEVVERSRKRLPSLPKVPLPPRIEPLLRRIEDTGARVASRFGAQPIQGAASRVAAGLEKISQLQNPVARSAEVVRRLALEHPLRLEHAIREPLVWTAIEAIHSKGDFEDRLEQAAAGTIVGAMMGAKGFFGLRKTWDAKSAQEKAHAILEAARRLQLVTAQVAKPDLIRRQFEGARKLEDVTPAGRALLQMMLSAPRDAMFRAKFRTMALRPDAAVEELVGHARPDLLFSWFHDAIEEAGRHRVAQDFLAFLEGRIPAFMVPEGGNTLATARTPQEGEVVRMLAQTPTSVFRLAGADVVRVPGKGLLVYWPERAAKLVATPKTLESGVRGAYQVRKAVEDRLRKGKVSDLLGFEVPSTAEAQGDTLYVGLDVAGNEVRTVIGTKKQAKRIRKGLRAAGARFVLELDRTPEAEEAIVTRRRSGLIYRPLVTDEGVGLLGRPMREIEAASLEAARKRVQVEAVRRLRKGLPPPVVLQKDGKIFLYDPLPEANDPLRSAEVVAGDIAAWEDVAGRLGARRIEELGGDWVAAGEKKWEGPLSIGHVMDAEVYRQASDAVLSLVGRTVGAPYASFGAVDPAASHVMLSDRGYMRQLGEGADEAEVKREEAKARRLANRMIRRVYQALEIGGPAEMARVEGPLLQFSESLRDDRVRAQVVEILTNIVPTQDTVMEGGFFRAMERLYRAVEYGRGRQAREHGPLEVLLDTGETVNIEEAPGTWTADPRRSAEILRTIGEMYPPESGVRDSLGRMAAVLDYAADVGFGPDGVRGLVYATFGKVKIHPSLVGTYRFTDYTHFQSRSLNPEEDAEFLAAERILDAKRNKGAIQEWASREEQGYEVSEGAARTKKAAEGSRVTLFGLPEEAVPIRRAEHIPDLFGVVERPDGKRVAVGDFVGLALIPREHIVAPTPYARVMRAKDGRIVRVHEIPGLAKRTVLEPDPKDPSREVPRMVEDPLDPSRKVPEQEYVEYPLPVKPLSQDVIDRIRLSASSGPDARLLDGFHRLRLGLKAGPTLVWKNPADGKFYVVGREQALRYMDELHLVSLARKLESANVVTDAEVGELLKIGSRAVQQVVADFLRNRASTAGGKSGTQLTDAEKRELARNLEWIKATLAEAQEGELAGKGPADLTELDALTTDPSLRMVRVIQAPTLDEAIKIAEKVQEREAQIARFQEERKAKAKKAEEARKAVQESTSGEGEGEGEAPAKIEKPKFNEAKGGVYELVRRRGEGEGEGRGEGGSAQEGGEGEGEGASAEGASGAGGGGQASSSSSGRGEGKPSGAAAGARAGDLASLAGIPRESFVVGEDAAGKVVASRAYEEAPPPVVEFHLAQDKVDDGLVPAEVKSKLQPDQITGAALMIAATNHPVPERRAALLADGAGVGKTRQALTTALAHMQQGRAVIYVTNPAIAGNPTSPETVKGQLRGELDALGMEVFSVASRSRGAHIKAGKLTLSSYDAETLQQLHDAIDKANAWDRIVVIFDESQALKNVFQSKRSGAGMALANKSYASLFVSATALDDPSSVLYLARIGFGDPKNPREVEEKYGLKRIPNKRGGFRIAFDTQFTYELPNGKVIRNTRKDPAASRLALYDARDRLVADGKIVRRDLGFEAMHLVMRPVEFDAEKDKKLAKLIAGGAGKGVNPAAGQGLIRGIHAAEAVVSQEAARVAARAWEEGYSPVIVGSVYNDLTFTVEGKKHKVTSPMLKAFARLVAEGVDPEQVAWVMPKLPDALEKVARPSEPGEGPPDSRMVELSVNTPQGPIEVRFWVYDAAGEMAAFQSGEKTVALVSRDYAGVGVDLDDKGTGRPRKMILMTPHAAGDRFVQVLGRVLRRTTVTNPVVELLMPEDSRGFAAKSVIESLSRGFTDTKSIHAASGGGLSSLIARLYAIHQELYKADKWARERLTLAPGELKRMVSGGRRSAVPPGEPARLNLKPLEGREMASAWALVRDRLEKSSDGDAFVVDVKHGSIKEDIYQEQMVQAADNGWPVFPAFGRRIYAVREYRPEPSAGGALVGGVYDPGSKRFVRIEFRDGWASGIEQLRKAHEMALARADAMEASVGQRVYPVSMAVETARLLRHLVEGRGPRPRTMEEVAEMLELVEAIVSQVPFDRPEYAPYRRFSARFVRDAVDMLRDRASELAMETQGEEPC